MRESSITSTLIKHLREEMPGCVAFKHSDSSTEGVPDVSLTWAGKTAWLEIKYEAPEAEVRATQKIVMGRLARAGHAFYVIFRNTPEDTHTRLEFVSGHVLFQVPGINYRSVADAVRRMLRESPEPSEVGV